MVDLAQTLTTMPNIQVNRHFMETSQTDKQTHTWTAKESLYQFTKLVRIPEAEQSVELLPWVTHKSQHAKLKPFQAALSIKHALMQTMN